MLFPCSAVRLTFVQRTEIFVKRSDCSLILDISLPESWIVTVSVPVLSVKLPRWLWPGIPLPSRQGVGCITNVLFLIDDVCLLACCIVLSVPSHLRQFLCCGRHIFRAGSLALSQYCPCRIVQVQIKWRRWEFCGGLGRMWRRRRRGERLCDTWYSWTEIRSSNINQALCLDPLPLQTLVSNTGSERLGLLMLHLVFTVWWRFPGDLSWDFIEFPAVGVGDVSFPFSFCDKLLIGNVSESLPFSV